MSSVEIVQHPKDPRASDLMCPMCWAPSKGGECASCKLFLCAWCEEWVSWEEGCAGEDEIEDTICDTCWCRRNGLIKPEEKPKMSLPRIDDDPVRSVLLLISGGELPEKSDLHRINPEDADRWLGLESSARTLRARVLELLVEKRRVLEGAPLPDYMKRPELEKLNAEIEEYLDGEELGAFINVD